MVADQVGALLLAGQRGQPGPLGLRQRGLQLDLGRAVLEEALELLDERGLDDVGVGARRDVEDDEAQRGAVDEAPRRGVRTERGLLAADQPAHQPRGGEAADAVERHRGRR